MILRPHHHLRISLVVAAAILATGCQREMVDPEAEKSLRDDSPIQQAQGLLFRGEHERALDLATQVLIAAPRDADALQVAMNAHASLGRLQEAAEIAVVLAEIDSARAVEHWLRAFDWHLRAGSYTAAEIDLRSAITAAPDDPRGYRSLAQLLNAQGRRIESRSPVIKLIQMNTNTPQELVSLIELSSPFELVSFDEVLEDTGGTLFDLAQARYEYTAERDLALALQLIEDLAESEAAPVAVHAFHARLLSETSDSERFSQWLAQRPRNIEQHPEYWLALGSWLSRQQRDREAVRAFGESLRRDPTNRSALRALSASLDRLGQPEKARQSQQSLGTLDKIYRLALLASPAEAMWIAEQMQTLLRPWEALAWHRLAFSKRGDLQQHVSELARREQQIRAWEMQASEEQIDRVRLETMLGFDVTSYPLPDLTARTDSVAAVPEADDPARASGPIQLTEVAASLGVETQFVSDYPTDSRTFHLYQANGGGLAAFDYDLDGRCDLYVVQSGGDPRVPGDSAANQLFRQLPGATFGEVTESSRSGDRGYGQGVCAADANQDGFLDLVIANIGANAVYINQGDGTFLERSELIGGNADRWTSSVAMGDLDGDQLPDLVEVNYLNDPRIFDSPCENEMLNCTPQRFIAAADRFLRNRGDGSWEVWDRIPESSNRPNFGFGVVIANLDHRHGNDVFISNDGDTNHYWVSDPVNTDATAPYGLAEAAGVAGCAVGATGRSEACMGIASGDFDRNGLLDLMVINFYKEPVNLFLQNASGFFVDEARRWKLEEPSMQVLGFGAQAADLDNDGWLDAAVMNGHIYDARYANIPFRMLSQIFRGGRSGFTLQNAQSSSPYWQREHLARTLALWDFNRDGRMDLVANHLDQPIAVLQNQTALSEPEPAATQSPDERVHGWLQLELVGVTSERSAVGARVDVEAGGQRWSGWRTGGDGYMCTNEAVLHFGLGSSNEVDTVTVHWPSGTVQTLTSLRPNRRYLIIEGESTAEPRWASGSDDSVE